MRLLTLFAAGLFAGSVLAAPVPKDEKKVKDEEAILGTWKIEKFDTGVEGGPSEDAIAKVRMTFKKDGKLLLLDPSGKEKEGTFKLDATAKTKTVDLSAEGQPDALGVYELDGDTLRLCMAQSGGKTRPTEFKADGKGVILLTLQRVKDK